MYNIFLVVVLIFSIIYSLITTIEPMGLNESEKEKYGYLLDAKYSDISNKYDVEFHDPPETVDKVDEYGLDKDATWVYDTTQNKLVSIPRPKILSFPTYYTPGTYKYGAAAYVPSYEEAIVLSTLDKYQKFHTGTILAKEHEAIMSKPLSTVE